MSYSILFTSSSRKQLSKLPKDIQKRIVTYLETKIILNPLLHDKSLSGNKKGLWRYRVGDYRIICHISNKDLVVLILDVGHRRDVYG